MSSGLDLLRIARAHIGEPYQLGARAPFDDPDYAGPWDCAEFVSWCAYQVYGRKFGVTMHGDPYSGAWIALAEHPAHTLSVAEAMARPGAVLVRRAHHFGAGHVAISDGAGGTVEARSARAGVVAARAVGRIWDLGCALP